MVQLASVGIVGAFCVIGALIITLLVKSIIGLRVSEEEENWIGYFRTWYKSIFFILMK